MLLEGRHPKAVGSHEPFGIGPLGGRIEGRSSGAERERMEKDFHYDLVYTIAVLTEARSPEIIAYASQYVDDNSDEMFRVEGKGAVFPDRLLTGRGSYFPQMTQCRSPEAMTPFVQRYVFVPFHFLPGDSSVRLKGDANPYCVTPNSWRGRALVIEALKGGNPYEIGIALHPFADSWSHQRFTGLCEEWNAFDHRATDTKTAPATIGHGDAGKRPDILSERWVDPRFGNKRIHNGERALEAAREIFLLFQTKTQKGPLWKEVEREFEDLLAVRDPGDREERIRDFLRSRGDGAFPSYSRWAWWNEVSAQGPTGIALKPGFNRTHWYRFQQAAKAHLSRVLALIKDL